MEQRFAQVAHVDAIHLAAQEHGSTTVRYRLSSLAGIWPSCQPLYSHLLQENW